MEPTSRFGKQTGKLRRIGAGANQNPSPTPANQRAPDLFAFDAQSQTNKYPLPIATHSPRLPPHPPSGPPTTRGRNPRGNVTAPAAPESTEDAPVDDSAMGFVQHTLLPLASRSATADPNGVYLAPAAQNGQQPGVDSLKTGEDAIAFFARFGKNSPIKFVQLNQAAEGISFRPYDLVVVDPRHSTPDYFTMSETGLVHVQPKQPSEFIPLSEWMRQSTLFNVLTSIRFFKFYLVNKTFCTWRSNIRYKLYCQQRRKLLGKSFMGKESFCGPLLAINEAMLALKGVVLLDLRGQKMNNMEAANFMEYQASIRAEAAKRFEAIMETLQAEITGVCVNVNNLLQLQSHGGDEGGGGDGAGGGDAGLGFADPSQKSKSLVFIKQEQADRKRLQQRAATEREMLPSFIRLADYIMVESLVQLTVLTSYDFLNELLKTPRKTGLLETTVMFGRSSEIVFTPTCAHITSMLGQMSSAMVETVSKVPRILFTRPFATLVQNHFTKEPNVAEIIQDSIEYQEIRRDISAKVEPHPTRTRTAPAPWPLSLLRGTRLHQPLTLPLLNR
jgi:hypothetical protein